MNKYRIEIDGPYVFLCGDVEGRIGLADGEAVYLPSEVDAALAAKDAARAKLSDNIGELIGENNDYMERCDARDAVIAKLRDALSLTRCVIGANELAPVIKEIDEALSIAPSDVPAIHPDTDRLDKLPQCFHMLRKTHSGPALSVTWHLSYAPNNVYGSVRDAIDAHKGDSNGTV